MNYSAVEPQPVPGVLHVDVRREEERGILGLLGAARRLHERLEQALEAAGLSVAKYHALDQLARVGHPMPLSELATCLQCVRSNVTQLVDRLESDGLVRRVADPVDRRTTRAELTPLGAERHGSGAAAVSRVHEELVAQLTPDERATLLRALTALA
jgi:DNA-binding MarR family transcriptional regulator